MKKFLLSLLFCLFLAVPAFAQPVDETTEPVAEEPVVESLTDLDLPTVLKGLPNLKQGAIYSIEDNEFEYVSTAQVVVYKNFSLEVGYATDDKIVALVSYPILKLKDLGVETPVLDLIEFNIGVYGGVDFNEPSGSDNIDGDYGVSFTLINIKF